MNPDEQTSAGTLPGTASGRLDRKQVIIAVSRVWAWVFLFLLIVIFTTSVSISTSGQVNFLSLRNSQNILMAITPVLLMGLGQTFVIISAGIDLSVGWVMGLASVVSALVIRDLVAAGTSQEIAIMIGFAIGLFAAAIPGFISGVIIAKLRVPSFIVTLGMSFIARGAAFLLSGGNVVGNQPPGLRNFGNEALIYILSGEGGGIFFFYRPDVAGEALRRLDRVFQWPVVVTAIVVGIAIFVLHRTQFGRHTYAIGGSREAALRAGVPVDRHTIMLYTLSALTAGLAGVLHTARFSGGSSIAGDPLLLASIAAVIIGGVSLFGGYGTVVGTIIGALIIATLTTGLVMLNVQPFWQFIVVGTVVILAVLIDQARDLVIGRMETEQVQ
jgi:ribose/xylose/arabinose/galactoside ABC-type transport system permease subunit